MQVAELLESHTAVVKPKSVLECLEKELIELGVEFIKARIPNCNPLSEVSQ